MMIQEEKNRFSVKRAIKDALMELLSEKPYMDITVTDIVKKANVARTSFYRNYKSIENVVNSIVEERMQFFEQEIRPVMYSDDERKWREFLFHYIYQVSRDYKRIFSKNKNNIYCMQNMSIFFLKTNEKMEREQKENTASSIRDKYCAVGKMALISDIIKKWADCGMEESPEEMVNYIMGFITKF